MSKKPQAVLMACVVVALADAAFLTPLIGQILNVGPTMSFAVSSGLGLVGLAFMMHLGYRETELNNHHVGLADHIVHYSLWILLGLLTSAARFFAGPILGITAADGIAVWTISGFEVRQEDLILALIMLLIYLVVGLAAKAAVRNLVAGSRVGDNPARSIGDR